MVGSSGRLRRGRWPGVSLLVNAIGVRAEEIENWFMKVQLFCKRSKKKTLHMWSRAPQAQGQSPIGQDSRQSAGSNNFPENKICKTFFFSIQFYLPRAHEETMQERQ